MARDPNMPEAVAAWFEEQGLKQLAAFDPLRPYGVASIDELEALSPREFFVRHLEAEDPRVEVRVQMEAQGKEPPAAVTAQLDAAFRPSHCVVGSVAENDSTVLVLVRRGVGPALEAMPGWGRELTVLTVRRDGEEWRIWPTNGQLDPFAGFSFGIAIDESAYDDLAQRVVAWPDERAPEGRAYVVGYSPEERTVRGLVVELTRSGGEPLRIEIPASAFTDLLELLQTCAYIRDPE